MTTAASAEAVAVMLRPCLSLSFVTSLWFSCFIFHFLFLLLLLLFGRTRIALISCFFFFLSRQWRENRKKKGKSRCHWLIFGSCFFFPLGACYSLYFLPYYLPTYIYCVFFPFLFGYTRTHTHIIYCLSNDNNNNNKKRGRRKKRKKLWQSFSEALNHQEQRPRPHTHTHTHISSRGHVLGVWRARAL